MGTLTTPTYGFRYPDGSERVMDGDNAMGALGTDIENILKVLPLNPGILAPSGAFTVPQGTPVLVPGMTYTFTPTQSELVVAAFTCDVQIGGGDPGAVTLQAFLDGAGWKTASPNASPATTFRWPATWFMAQTLTPTPHTIEVRAGKNNAAGTVTIGQNSSAMMVLRWRR